MIIILIIIITLLVWILVITINKQENSKIENEILTQFMTLFSPINMSHRHCAVYTDPFHWTSDLISV